MRTVDPARHAAKRKEIIHAAYILFATRGFEATRTADICQATGMSSGNLFHYFPSKQAIFSAMFEDDAQQLSTQFSSAATTEQPLELLYAYLQGQAQEAEDPLVGGILPELLNRARADQEFADLLERTDAIKVQGLTTLLEHARELGQVPADLNIPQAIHWLTVVQEGLFIHAAGNEAFHPAAETKQLRALIDTILRRST